MTDEPIAKICGEILVIMLEENLARLEGTKTVPLKGLPEALERLKAAMKEAHDDN
jgi:hypothetical protein